MPPLLFSVFSARYYPGREPLTRKPAARPPPFLATASGRADGLPGLLGADGLERPQLLAIRHRIAPEGAIAADRIRAGAADSGRVDVQCHRGDTAVVNHAMDVRGTEVEQLAGAVRPRAGRGAAEQQPLLAHLALDHGDRAGGEIVVMESRVVARHPADQPGLHRGLVDDALEDARGGVVPHEVAPHGGVGGETPGKGPQLRDGECVTGPDRQVAFELWQRHRHALYIKLVEI